MDCSFDLVEMTLHFTEKKSNHTKPSKKNTAMYNVRIFRNFVMQDSLCRADKIY